MVSWIVYSGEDYDTRVSMPLEWIFTFVIFVICGGG